MIISDFINRTDQGICECRNPNCPSHELVANRKAGVEPSMKPMPCSEGETIVCGFCDQLKCIHLGERTNRRVECPSCSKKIGKTIFLRLYDCSVHGECIVTRKNIDGVISCRCSDYESE
jgi:hypothetical protein